MATETTTIEHHESDGMTNDRLKLILNTVGTYGIPAVLIVMFYIQVYKPDQDARRDLEKTNSQTLIQLGNSMQMLVEQDRRRENSTIEVLRIQQEQTRILQQIMIDQKRGAWNDEKRPTNGHATANPGE